MEKKPIKIIQLPIALFVLTIVFISSCSTPLTKESYLERYAEFISELENKSMNYTQEDWALADRKYADFSGVWYQKFKDELTWKEELRISRYQLEYNILNAGNSFKKLLNNIDADDIDSLKEKIQYYIDNNMEEDLEYIRQQAKILGEEILKMVDRIIDEYENR